MNTGFAKNPKSYNSQVGVSISTLALNVYDEIGVFEAGISQKREMQKLEKIIQPTLGIFTNIGQAHSENFESIEEKKKKNYIYLQRLKISFIAKIMRKFTSLFQQKQNPISWLGPKKMKRHMCT